MIQEQVSKKKKIHTFSGEKEKETAVVKWRWIMKDKSRDTVPLRRGGIYSLATVCTYSDSRCPLYTVYVCNIVNIHYTFPHQTYREMDIKR